jgi:SAM-dependent methyltransferase
MNYIKEIYRDLNVNLAVFRKKILGKRNLTETQKYWENPDDGHNNPISYTINKQAHQRTENLLNIIKTYICEGEVLEIGCNAGRNLAALYKGGYDKLTAIEINKNALKQFEKTNHDCYKITNVINSPVEKAIKTFENGSFDLVYTMAVLQHLHPESEWVFDEMARITRGYILTMEVEDFASWRHFPRNYKKVFEKRGMRQIYREGSARLFKRA